MGNTAKHRDALVRTAMRLFREQGYASTGLQQILAESGAPKGSLYYYFPGGKEELAVHAVNLAARLIGEMLADLARTQKTRAGFVEAYCTTMANWIAESDFRSGCPIATAMLETTPASPALAAAGSAAFDHWIDIIAPVLETDGRSSTDAMRDAASLVAAMEGALILARVRQSTRPILDIVASYR